MLWAAKVESIKVFMGLFLVATRSLKNFKLIALLSLLFSGNALATTASFSFSEFNLAFVLGVSLPIILTAAMLRKSFKTVWLFPCLILFCALIFFQTLAVSTPSAKLLSAAGALMALIFIWPFYNKSEFPVPLVSRRLMQIIIAITVVGTAGFIASTWLAQPQQLPDIWGLFSIFLLTLALVQIIPLFKNPELRALRLVLQWITAAIFALSLYFWLNSDASVNWVVSALVMMYLMTIINGNWFMAEQVLQSVMEPAPLAQVSNEDIYLFTHDPTTNLPTYQQALKCFEHAIKANEKSQFAAIVLQPINFHQVNTVLGHHNSDILLLQFAYSLQKSLTPDETLLSFELDGEPVRIARLNGLHFLVIIDLSTSQHPPATIVEALCKQLSRAVPQAMSFKSFSLNFELAFGVALSKEHGRYVNEIIANAEDALLKSLQSKKTLTYFDHQIPVFTEQQLAKMEALKKDIHADQLDWYVMPQLSLTDNKLIGFELLVRWHYLGQEKLELDEFLITAEHSGETHILIKQMINKAFELIAVLEAMEINLPVAINLLSDAMWSSELLELLNHQADINQASVKQLMIEFDEKILLKQHNSSKSVIEQLRAQGIKFAIDNFSGNYESLRYLRRLAIDCVKVDCQHLGEDDLHHADKAISNALINLTKSMEVPLIGINITNQEINSAFLSIGGDYGQGKYIAASFRHHELEPWLNYWHKQQQ